MATLLMVPALAVLLAAGSGPVWAGPRGGPVQRDLAVAAGVHLGLRLVETTAQLRTALGVAAEQGALVMDVTPDGPASQAGLAAGDVITRVAGHPVGGGDDVLDALGERKPGDTVAVDYVRARSPRTAQVTLAAVARRTPPMGRWAPQLRGELRRFHDDVERRLRELEQRLRRLEDDAPPERTALPG